MSEPITLTERERAVFAELTAYLMGEAHSREIDRAWQIGEVLRAWLRDMAPPAESASPPPRSMRLREGRQKSGP